MIAQPADGEVLRPTSVHGSILKHGEHGEHGVHEDKSWDLESAIYEAFDSALPQLGDIEV